MSVLGFICIFSDSQENKRYLHRVIKTNLHKRKLALNSWLVKSLQLNLFSFNEDLVWNLSPAGKQQPPQCFNFIISLQFNSSFGGFFCKETKPYKISSVKLPNEKGIRLLKWALNSVLAYSLVEAGRLYFHG